MKHGITTMKSFLLYHISFASLITHHTTSRHSPDTLYKHTLHMHWFGLFIVSMPRPLIPRQYIHTLIPALCLGL